MDIYSFQTLSTLPSLLDRFGFDDGADVDIAAYGDRKASTLLFNALAQQRNSAWRMLPLDNEGMHNTVRIHLTKDTLPKELFDGLHPHPDNEELEWEDYYDCECAEIDEIINQTLALKPEQFTSRITGIFDETRLNVLLKNLPQSHPAEDQCEPA